MTRCLLVLLTLALLLSGCTDPVRQAKAKAIEMEAQDSRNLVNVEVAATATAVAVWKELADLRISATATATADEETVMAETQNERIARKEKVISATTKAFVAIIVSACVAFCVVSIGGATAASRKANLEARLIRIDKTTRTWPILLDTKSGYIVNLETGERALLTDAAPVNPGQLAISGQVRTAGLLAQAAENIAKSTKDAKPGDMLPAIGQSAPLLEVNWLPKLEEGLGNGEE